MQRQLIRSVETPESWRSNPISSQVKFYELNLTIPELIKKKGSTLIRYSFVDSPRLTSSLPYDMFTIHQDGFYTSLICRLNNNEAANIFLDAFNQKLDNPPTVRWFATFYNRPVGEEPGPSTYMFDATMGFPSDSQLSEKQLEYKKFIEIFLEVSGIEDEEIKKNIFNDLLPTKVVEDRKAHFSEMTRDRLFTAPPLSKQNNEPVNPESPGPKQ